MWLTLDLASETPLYVQIRNQVIEGILVGNVNPGDKLPSVRQLASDLGINMLTVNKAYTLLKGEGFIRIFRQRGAEICTQEEYAAGDGYLSGLREAARPLIVEAFCRGVSKAQLMSEIEALCKPFAQFEAGGDKND